MRDGKFASLTAGLLVRKGEAAPSMVAPGPAHPNGRSAEGVEREPARASAPEWQESPPRIVAPERDSAEPVREIALHSDHPDKPRRLMVSLSAEEYEMLGLIGVKKNATRHQLLRIAFDEYLLQLVEEFGEGCHCIANGGTCDAIC